MAINYSYCKLSGYPQLPCCPVYYRFVNVPSGDVKTRLLADIFNPGMI